MLILLAGCFGDNDQVNYDNYTVKIVDLSNDEAIADHHGHWHGELPAIPLNEHISLGVVFEDEDGSEIPLDGEYQFEVQIANNDEEIITTESYGDYVHLHCEATGKIDVKFQLVDDNYTEWGTPDSIEIEVTEELLVQR